MPCTTLLVGKKATYDGSTMIARNEDSGGTGFAPKKFIVVKPEEQPRQYVSVISKVKIDLPDDPMRYTAMPNADPSEGNWSAAGVNTAGVSMTATETLTTNERVLSGDPFEKGGIGEEDIVTLVLPYIRSAREGVARLGMLLETYGTYEMNGIAFSDLDEVWWLETIGGHHWIARLVPEDSVVINPNQFGTDSFDLEDALGAQKEHMCSADMREFISEYFLDLNQDGEFNPRDIFGSRRDQDHIYNTPRAWFMGRYLAPYSLSWDGPNAEYGPESDDIPWSIVPDRKVTVEDVKYLLSSHYQGTPYDPYSGQDTGKRGIYRSIGINRTGDTALCQIRSGVPDEVKCLEWVCFGATTFSAMMPVYPNVPKMHKYLSEVTMDVDSNNFYWASRLIDALADHDFAACIQNIERYHNAVAVEGRLIVREYDAKVAEALKGRGKKAEKAAEAEKLLLEANAKLCAKVKELTTDALGKVLATSSEHMKNGFNRADN